MSIASPTPALTSQDSSQAEYARRRLLSAAAACFARKGYSGTTVRDITIRAGCNVSAVTYHFGGKHKVYIALFEERLSELTRHRADALEALLTGTTPTLERVIETFAVAFLNPLHSSERGRETMLLLLREMVDGHLPSSIVADHLMRPTLRVLTQALERTCPGYDLGRLTLCCHSLVSQLVHVLHLQRLHKRGRGADLPRFELNQTVHHIVQFTAAGIRACRGEETP